MAFGVWRCLFSRREFSFDQRDVRPGLRMVFQVLQHCGLHMGNQMDLPIVNQSRGL